jgi:hypothetical protein
LLLTALPMALAAQDTTTVKATLMAADRAAAASTMALGRATAPLAAPLGC